MGIENLRYYTLNDDYDCAAGVTGIVLRTFRSDIDFTHEQLILGLGITEEYGADPADIVRFLQSWGLVATFKTDVTLGEIQVRSSLGPNLYC